MKDYALELLVKVPEPSKKLNTLREFLQALIIRILQEKGYFKSFAFIGGTALRLLYSLPRFSEDLDFSLVKKVDFNFEDLLKKLKDYLIASGFQIDITYNKEKTVYSAFVKFKSLLYEAKISPLKSQNLAIKLDIDTNPPAGADLEIKLLTVYFPLEITTFKIESLMAGKCSAILTRNYTKGRDLFDLAWYLTNFRNIKPNLTLLKNSLAQNNWNKTWPDNTNWKSLLAAAVNKMDWIKVEADTINFIDRGSDLNIFRKENLLYLLEQKY